VPLAAALVQHKVEGKAEVHKEVFSETILCGFSALPSALC
jgi:hypothetical protein